jgi:hypothetical protein
MIPTPKLRFVERDSYSKNGEHFVEPFKVRILQQWWIPENADRTSAHYKGEWRDVPIEKEQT